MTTTAERYRFGQTDEDGRTPVYVDGSDTPSGIIARDGRGQRRWTARPILDATGHGGGAYRVKDEAATEVVAAVDRAASVRAAMAQLPTVVGWRYASWEEIEQGRIRVVRPVECEQVYRRHRAAVGEPVTMDRLTVTESWVFVAGEQDGNALRYLQLFAHDWRTVGALVPDDTPARAGEPEGWLTVGDVIERPDDADARQAPKAAGPVVRTRLDYETGTRTLAVDLGFVVTYDVPADTARRAESARGAVEFGGCLFTPSEIGAVDDQVPVPAGLANSGREGGR
ncbi:hypothetical protein ACWDBD_19745 [Streptomyces sp. NPDC001118]